MNGHQTMWTWGRQADFDPVPGVQFFFGGMLRQGQGAPKYSFMTHIKRQLSAAPPYVDDDNHE